MYASLSFGEITFYCVTWVSAVFYSVYQLWDATHFMNPNRYKAYEVGWSISVKDDSSDYEWQMWVPFLLFKVPWLVSHFVGAELVRRNNIELLPVWYVLISAIFLLNYVGAFATAVLVMKCALIYALHLLRSRILLWAVCVTLIIGYNMGDIVDVLSLERREHYMMSVCGSWVLLRCIGFCLDALKASPSTPRPPMPVEFVLYLSYCLYLPVLFLGPVIMYSDFQVGLKQTYKRWTFPRILCALLSLLRYVFWGLVIDAILHYLYFNSFVMIPKTVRMGNWALYGYGYALGQFFMVKYVVVYGIGSSVARLEQIDAPHNPKCIARVHLYSYMWRHFDQGLYLFLLKYIYLPCCGHSKHYWNKLFASLMCFVFVYVWHTTHFAILIWTLLNFIGVTLEGLGKQISASAAYRKWEDSTFSPQGIRRFHALLATPIFMMSALSNFYFLGSYAIGQVFVSRLLNASAIAAVKYPLKSTTGNKEEFLKPK
ncbi:Protein-cysteine N-palmitoyltransferase Rasp, partial [Gryllus bimaculatus]